MTLRWRAPIRRMQTMSRDGSITFGGLVGKLDTLRVACDEFGLNDIVGEC
jgi:hypothetical protein